MSFKRKGARRALTASALFAIALPHTALAATNGTWTNSGGTLDLPTAANWSTNPTTPDGIATFDSTATGPYTPSMISAFGIQGFSFPLTNAQAYTFAINGSTAILTFGNGAGITNNSGLAQTFNVTDGTVDFLNSTSADSTGSGLVTFNFLGATGSTITFQNTSTASNANFVLNNVGELLFQNSGSDTFSGSISGTGGTNGVIANVGGTLTFTGTSNSYSGTTQVNSCTLRAGAVNTFSANSDYSLNAGGILNLNGNSNTIGSLAGLSGSSVTLGSGTLTLNNSSSTTFAGNITGTGGLTKNATSTGVLTLSGTGNTYSGTTTLSAGTLRAGAANSFSGSSDVSITAGTTLDLNNFNNAIATLAGTGGTVSLGSGTLTMNGTGSTLFSGAITGTGGLTKAGTSTGTFTLSGASNTYSGTTALNAGTLRAGIANGFSPNSAVTLVSGATLDLNNFNNSVPTVAGSGGTIALGSATLTLTGTANTTFSGAITGTGGITKSGTSTGTFTLSGTSNVYSGTTSLSGGTLKAGAASSFSPNSAISMLAGTTLDLNNFNQSIPSLAGTGGTVSLGSGTLTMTGTATTTFSGGITGTGGLTKAGTSTGVFTLGAASNTYSGSTTLSAGTFRAGTANAFSPNSSVSMVAGAALDLNNFNNTISGLSGTGGTIAVGAASFTFGNGSNNSFAGNFTGTGTMHVVGAGSTTLTGNSSSFSGTTHVEGNLLALNGSLGGNVLVETGATLGGTGTIGGNLTVNNGGTIAPGNSIGTMTVSGNYTNNTSATYLVEVNNSQQSDLINVTGSATLNGGTVSVTPLNGYNVNQDYVILNAHGGITGTFGTLTQLPLGDFLQLELDYTATQAILVFKSHLIDGACSPNARAIATQFDALHNPNAEEGAYLVNLAFLSAGDLCDALEGLSGDQYTHTGLIAESLNHQFLHRLYQPLRPLVTKQAEACSCEGMNSWFQIDGGHLHIDGTKHTSSVNVNGVSLTAGAQQEVCRNWTIGLAASYEYDSLNFKHNSDGNAHSCFGGLYGLYRPERGYLLGKVAYGDSSMRVNREIRFADIKKTAHGKPRVSYLSTYAEGGFDLHLCRSLIQPFLALEVDRCSNRAFTEKKADELSLKFHREGSTTTFGKAGVHITKGGHCWEEIALTVDAAWRYRFNHNKSHFRERFSGFGSNFDVHGTKLTHHAIEGAIALSKGFCNNWRASADLSYEGSCHTSAFHLVAHLDHSW